MITWSRSAAWITALVSCGIVTYGEPAWVPALGILAGIGGYALFWKEYIKISSRKKQFTAAVSWYAAVQLVQLSWMSSITYQGVYMLLVMLVLALGMGVQFAILSHCLPKDRPLILTEQLALSGCWVFMEWVRLFFLCGFSLNFSGMALSSTLWSMQFAAIVGIFGLSFWVIFTNLSVFNVLQKKSYSAGSLALVGCIAAAPYVFGAARLAYFDHFGKEGKTMAITAIQTNFLPPEKVPLTGFQEMFIPPLEQWEDVLYLLSQSGASHELIVLPEAAICFGYNEPVYLYEEALLILKKTFGNTFELPPLQMPYGVVKGNLGWVTNAFFAQAIANASQSEVMIGLDYFDQVQEKSYNSAFHFTPNAADHGRYNKQILVPLAEYLPFQWCRKLAKRYGITSFFTQGAKDQIIHGRYPMGVSICYEETFSSFMHGNRKLGALLFVNLTNDGWYPDSKLFKQHFDHARLRAVENGIPLVRSCNGGISAIIDPFGRVYKKLGENRKGVVSSNVEIQAFSTIYQKMGDSLAVGASMCFFLIFGIVKVKNGAWLKRFQN